MKLGIFSGVNEYVHAGVIALLTKYGDESPEVIFPVTASNRAFAMSTIDTCKQLGINVTVYCEKKDELKVDDVWQTISDDPVTTAIHNLGKGDAVGIMWTDSEEDHYIIHSVEDLALDIWDITDGLSPIEGDPFFNPLNPEVLRDTMLDSFEKFVDILSAYVAATVMDSLGQAVSEHLAERILNKDITPFDDLD